MRREEYLDFLDKFTKNVMLLARKKLEAYSTACSDDVFYVLKYISTITDKSMLDVVFLLLSKHIAKIKLIIEEGGEVADLEESVLDVVLYLYILLAAFTSFFGTEAEDERF